MHRFSVGGASPELVRQVIQESVGALESENHQYFSKALPARETWRAWKEFRHNCVYLDIETDGGNWGNSVTTIGLYDGNEFTCLIKGHDLENFRDIISRYSMIVTFFGTGFDLPVLEKCFPGIGFDHIHIDLCFAMKQLGYRGGLKKIETQLGIQRSPQSQGLTGRDAITLWRRYLMGSDAALETLVAYNREDVVNLEKLADHAFTRLTARTLYDVGLCERDGKLAKLGDREQPSLFSDVLVEDQSQTVSVHRDTSNADVL